MKEILIKMALDNIKAETEGMEWIIDSDDLPERVRDNATYKAIEEYADKNNIDSQELIWDCFNDIDEQVGNFLNKKYKCVYDKKDCYYYDRKFNFDTVGELEKYFKIVRNGDE